MLEGDAMLALSGFVLRHKLAVAVFWLAVLAAGAVASAAAERPAVGPVRAARRGRATGPTSRSCGCTATAATATPRSPWSRLPPGHAAASAAGRLALGRAFGAVAAIRGLRVADYASTGDRAFLTATRG